jgi:hypothetical protein
MKKLLLQLDSDKFTSVFDTITAYDAGVDHVLHYGGVAPDDVREAGWRRMTCAIWSMEQCSPGAEMT